MIYIYIYTHKCKRLSRAMIGHNRMTHQPSCLQCKQADRDCVSRSRLFVADVFHAFVQTTADVALSLCPSCSGVDIVVFVVWARSGLWTLIHHHSAMLQSRQAWEEEGIVLQMGTSPPRSSVPLRASFSVTLIILPQIEPHITVTKRLHAILLVCGTQNYVCVCLILLSSLLTFITVSSLNWLHGVHYVASCGAEKYDFSLLCMFISVWPNRSNISPICDLSTVNITMIWSHKVPYASV